MALPVARQLATIARHAGEAAQAAAGHLDAPVTHCPGWAVSDVLAHLVRVHWFWATIVEQERPDPPEESERPPTPPRVGLIDAFVAGAAHMTDVFARADQSHPVWTWSPVQGDVAFVTRHQVQEMAVHHFDVAHAAGSGFSMEPEVAADCVAEFLRISVASDEDPLDPPGESLDGTLVIACSDTADAWTLSDGRDPGTVLVSAGATGEATLRAPASELLLWLYNRTEIPPGSVDAALLGRFVKLIN